MTRPAARHTDRDVVAALDAVADPVRAVATARFFKTGPGEYGEGDVFIGVRVPDLRRAIRPFAGLRLVDLKRLLASQVHEHRLAALMILVEQYRGGGDAQRQAIYDLYLASTERINNWDLVDASAEHIVGAHTFRAGLWPLVPLAQSSLVWDRRIAMVACFDDIKRGDATRPLAVATMLAYDDHDLIQKAVGWMLREVGKRCGRAMLVDWLLDDDRRYRRLPRTELRYAIEHFEPEERRRYLHGTA